MSSHLVQALALMTAPRKPPLWGLFYFFRRLSGHEPSRVQLVLALVAVIGGVMTSFGRSLLGPVLRRARVAGQPPAVLFLAPDTARVPRAVLQNADVDFSPKRWTLLLAGQALFYRF